MKRYKKVLIDCLRKNKIAIILFVLSGVFNGAVFLLYDIMREAFVYAQIIMFAALALLIGIDYLRELKSAQTRERIHNDVLIGNSFETPESTLRDEDYSETISALTAEIQRLQTEFSAKKQADDDYYTAWVHQIKTPIATMKLQLTEDTKENKALSAELFRIEQYVEMVLDYIRLESDSRDLLVREYSLDALIREPLRKFAPQFIMRKLRLSYEPTEKVIVTDKKWFIFILEQLISNAIKYTPTGEIKISADDNCVKISDTGIGIAPEDLPRIFEKGYTGVNGRIGQKSSGLGLFLTKKAADLIAVTVSVESTAGKGTVFSVSLPDSSRF